MPPSALSDALEQLHAAFGAGEPAVGSDRLRVRYIDLATRCGVDPNGREPLLAILSRAGVLVESINQLPLSLSGESGVMHLATGTLAGAPLIAQGSGVSGCDVIEIEVFAAESLAAERRESARFLLADKLFSGKDGAALLGRYLAYTIAKRPREQAKALVRACAETIADFVSG